MTTAHARPRYAHCLALVLVVGLAGLLADSGCGSSTPGAPVRVVDLTREMDRAEQRPPGGFTLGDYRVGDTAYPAIAAAVPSRLTVPVPLPRHGILHAFVAHAPLPDNTRAGTVRLRIGISDHRIYEALRELILTPSSGSWVDLRVDLSAYAGWKWSLFYRPEQVIWRVVLAADAMDSVPATVLWGTPEILTDTRSAREYSARRQRMR
jgi:hypothetical protein